MERFRNTGQPDWDWWGRVWPTPGATLRDLGVAPGDRVAEVGSGNGYFALPAARIAAPGTVYALDVDADLLAELDALTTAQGIENVRTVAGDARDLPSPLPEPVDVALLMNAFHGVPEPEAVVAGVADSLADGGSLVVVNWRDRPREETRIGGEPRGPPTELRMSPTATREAVEAAGTDLAFEREVDLPPFHYALVFER
ncbi:MULTISPECIES: class I SAM-dependent methyltransferase [Halorubrum]|uniref:Methyltransferase domain-containing protein n=1 Tax=Halorubrum sodomense TaxID=35743 RepID=A0A1I6H834_HALSD|nr:MULTISPECIES: class I SAM-dependent methyltransferase [Halorubrum]TKX71435.1 class I SAM-dependent methyltransferase [Halorubrum sp. SP9]SFR50625.1 Methyltransferase domain-containing protein [Halorubrum sodomense]